MSHEKEILRQITHLDVMIASLTQQDARLSQYLNRFKEKIANREAKQHRKAESDNVVDEEKIKRQLQLELQSARIMLRNYQRQLKTLHRKSSANKFSACDLLQLDDSIRERESNLRNLYQEVKQLNIAKRKQEKEREKREKEEKMGRIIKLSEEVRKQKEIMQGMKTKRITAAEALEKRKAAVQVIEQTYQEQCRRKNQKVVSFQELKEKESHKIKHQSKSNVSLSAKKDVKKHQTVWQIINSPLVLTSFEVSQKSLEQLKIKKQIALQSLKLAYRKHDKQIQQLTKRLQSLREENATLKLKYLEKKKECQALKQSQAVPVQQPAKQQ